MHTALPPITCRGQIKLSGYTVTDISNSVNVTQRTYDTFCCRALATCLKIFPLPSKWSPSSIACGTKLILWNYIIPMSFQAFLWKSVIFHCYRPLDTAYHYDDWHITLPYAGRLSRCLESGCDKGRRSLSPGGSVRFRQRKSSIAMNSIYNCGLLTNSVKLATKEPR